MLSKRRVNMHARSTLLTCLVRSKLTYAVQSWQLTERQIDKLSAAWNRMLRRMVRGGFARKVPDDDSNFALKISNVELYKITGCQPLRDFIKKQQLHYAGHVTRMRNDCWQKRTLFIQNENNGKGYLRKYSEDLGGIDTSQTLRFIQAKLKLRQELDRRFGNRQDSSVKNC